MATKYDKKTVQRSYSILNKTLLQLDEQEMGFKREVRRYKKLKDIDNMDEAFSAVQGIQFAKQQINKVKRLMSKEFRGKLN